MTDSTGPRTLTCMTRVHVNLLSGKDLHVVFEGDPEQVRADLSECMAAEGNVLHLNSMGHYTDIPKGMICSISYDKAFKPGGRRDA